VPIRDAETMLSFSTQITSHTSPMSCFCTRPHSKISAGLFQHPSPHSGLHRTRKIRRDEFHDFSGSM